MSSPLFRNSTFWKSRKKVTSPSIPNERISLRKDSILQLNEKGTFLMVPILEADEVTEIEGFVIQGHDEPYVFIERVHIVPLLKAMHLKPFQDCVKMTNASIQNQNPIKFMEWLLYQGVLQVESAFT